MWMSVFLRDERDYKLEIPNIPWSMSDGEIVFGFTFIDQIERIFFDTWGWCRSSATDVMEASLQAISELETSERDLQHCSNFIYTTLYIQEISRTIHEMIDKCKLLSNLVDRVMYVLATW